MFSHTIAKPWHFSCVGHTEAFNRLLFLVENREHFGILEGVHGIGKTTLLQQLQRKLLRSRCSASVINASVLDVDSLLWQIAGALSIAPVAHESRSEVLAVINDELEGRAACGQSTVLLLDDIDRTGDDVTNLIDFLQAIGQRTQNLTVIVSTDRSPGRELRLRSPLQIRLEPLTAEEAGQFVEERLQTEYLCTAAFDDQTVEAIHDMTRGIPSNLNRLSDMLAAVRTTSPNAEIDAELVRSVAAELLS